MLRLLLVWTLVAASVSEAQSPGFVLPETVPALEAAVRVDSNDAAAHYNLALGYWNYVRYDDAVAQLRLAIQLDPDFAPPYVAMYAITYAEWPALWHDASKLPDSVQRREVEAEQMFRRGMVTDPQVDLRTLGAARPPVPHEIFLVPELLDWYNKYGRGFDDLYNGDYQSAFNVFDRLMRIYPKRDSVPSGDIWAHGIAAEHLREDSVARVDFQRLVARVSASQDSKRTVRFPLRTAEYEYILGIILIRMGHAPEAVTHLRSAAVADAGLYVAHARLAEIAEAGEDWEDAIRERQAAADAGPEDARLLVYLAATFLKAGRAAEAEAPVRQAAALAPRDFEAAFVLGVVEMHLGKKAEARTALTSAVALAPRRFGALLADARKRLSQLQ